ncbi:MAG: hypothetical protein ABH803_01000 [Candidatus Micrarchaeota archaeon]
MREELKKSIDVWYEDLHFNKHKQALFEHLSNYDWMSIRDNVEKIGSKAKRGKTKYSMVEVGSAVVNREKTLFQLAIVNEFISHARGSPPVLVAGESELANRNNAIEELQKTWLKDTAFREEVLKFKENLEKASHAYNKQVVVTALSNAVMQLPHGDDWHKLFGHEEWRKLTRDDAFKELNALDSYFYSEGNRWFLKAGKNWSKLNKHPVGNLFTLSPKELVEESRRARYPRE